jgi:hypothetical protein
MRSLLVALAVLAAALSDCAQPSPAAAPTPQPAAPPATNLALPWTLTDCRALTAFFDVDSQKLQALLPPGFAPGPRLRAGQTTMGVDAFRCKSGAGANGTLQDIAYDSFWANAVPPKALQGDVKLWYVKWDTLVADQEARALLLARNASVRAGTVDIVDAAPAPGSPVTGTMHLEGVGHVVITVGPAPPLPGGNGGALPFREYSPAGPEGKDVVTWQAVSTTDASQAAAGVVDVPAGSVPAKLYGDTRIPAQVSVRAFTFKDGSIDAAP